MRQLDGVVEKADRGAAERYEEDEQRVRGVVRERQERDAERDEDHQASQRRRPGLHEVVLRAFLANVLAVPARAHEADEPRGYEDRDDEGDDARDEHPYQRRESLVD